MAIRNLIISILLMTAGQLAHADQETLEGNSFSDPTHIYNMSPQWIKQPIKYEPAAANADLVITLGQHLYPHLSPGIQRYAREHNIIIAVNEGTCGITSGKLSRKAVDIGGFCCTPGETDRLPGLNFHTLGVSALTIIVHPDNPIKNITLNEAREVFMGTIKKWSELQDTASEEANTYIEPVARLHCKKRPGSWHLLLANEDLFSPEMLEVGAIPDMVYSVSINPMAIGYETMTAIHRYYQHRDGPRVKTLKVDGYNHYEPSNILNTNYKLYRVYNLTTWEGGGTENTHAQDLVTFLIKEIEQLDSKFGVIPASRLRKAGWTFHKNELSGKPR